MTFSIKEAVFTKDAPIDYSSIEHKRVRIAQNIDKWLEYMKNGKPKDSDEKFVAPMWLSKQEGDKVHYRLKFAQRNIAIGPKGEDRMTVDESVPQHEVFEFLKQRIIAGAYDASIKRISEEIKKSYRKDKK